MTTTMAEKTAINPEAAPATRFVAPEVLELELLAVGMGPALAVAVAPRPTSPPVAESRGKLAPSALAAATKAEKVLLPVVGALMAPTIPEPQ